MLAATKAKIVFTG